MYLAEQKVALDVPQVRNLGLRQEVPWPRTGPCGIRVRPRRRRCGRFCWGLSWRDTSRARSRRLRLQGRFKRASARTLAQLQARAVPGRHDLRGGRDGDRDGGDDAGSEDPAGLVQTETENGASCAAFLRGRRTRFCTK